MKYRLTVLLPGILAALIAIPFLLSFLTPLHYTRGMVANLQRLPAQEFLLRDGRFLWLRRTPIDTARGTFVYVTRRNSMLFKWRIMETPFVLLLDPEDRSYSIERLGSGGDWKPYSDLGLVAVRHEKLVLSAWTPGIPIIVFAAYPALVLTTHLVSRIRRSILRRRRLRMNHCLECGYDLTGNVSGVCPECGERIAGAAEQPSRTGPT